MDYSGNECRNRPSRGADLTIVGEYMKNNLIFVALSPNNVSHCAIFTSLMKSYIAEMNEHSHRPLPEMYWQKWIDSIIRILGDQDRHLELCRLDNEWIGFLYGKADHEDHKGFIKPGYGYIMEFYVRPEYRRKGIGSKMLERMEALFRNDGIKNVYLTADPVTGKPFWEAMAYKNSGEISPDNRLEIYEKTLSGSN